MRIRYHPWDFYQAIFDDCKELYQLRCEEICFSRCCKLKFQGVEKRRKRYLLTF